MASQEVSFKPINTVENFQAGLEYIAASSQLLAKLALGYELPIDTICLFTHSEAEYDFVERLVRSHGPESKFTHGATLYVDTDMQIGEQRIHILGVRKPDDTRIQVGYGDYPIADYEAFLSEVADNQFTKKIVSGRGQPLVELRHPDLNVLGYAFAAREHE